MFIGKYDIIKDFIDEYKDEIVNKLHKHPQAKNFDINNIDHRHGLEIVLNGIFEYFSYMMNNPVEMQKTSFLPIRHVADLHFSIVRATLYIYQNLRQMVANFKEDRNDETGKIIHRLDVIDNILRRIQYWIDDNSYYYQRRRRIRYEYIILSTLRKIKNMMPSIEIMLNYFVSRKYLTKEAKDRILRMLETYDKLLHLRENEGLSKHIHPHLREE